MSFYFELKKMRELRERYFLKQYDICRYIGVSDVAYRTWELRVRKPNDEHFKALRTIFGILSQNETEIASREDAIDILDREFVIDA